MEKRVGGDGDGEVGEHETRSDARETSGYETRSAWTGSPMIEGRA